MAKKKAQPQLPAWVWLFTGVVTGLFAAFLVYLANVKGSPVENNTRPRPSYNNGAPPSAGYSNKPGNATSSRPSGSTNTTADSSATSGSAATSSARTGGTVNNTPEPLSTEDRARRFEFYTLLPEAETLGAQSDDEKPAASKTDPAKPADTKATTSKQRTLLQTGSFQRAQDAEKLRAQIILLGLPASIQKVQARPGETWHRVQAGPFNDAASLANAQKTLKDARIQHIVIRMKNS